MKLTTTRRPQLKVAWSRSTSADDGRTVREPVQLSLQLGCADNLIACVGQERLSGSTLSSLLRTLRPSYLLDLRACPRFDLSDGYTRKKAFADLERWGAKYLFLTADETTGNLSERVRTLVNKLSKDASQVTGPLVVVVETEDAVEQISRALPRPARQQPWQIRFEGLSGDDTQSPTRALRCV